MSNKVLSESTVIFNSGKKGEKNSDGVGNYRIPALLTTDKGTIIAGADQRYEHQWDWGNIDMVIRRSEDKGKTWGPIIPIVDLAENDKAEDKNVGSAFNIDMNLVQDPETKRIFALYDMYSEGKGLFGMLENPDKHPQHVEINGSSYLALYTKTDEVYSVREDGVVYSADNQVTDYRVVTHTETAPYKDLGNIYKNNELVGNVYFNTNSDSPFTISRNIFIWLSYSDDDGLTWSCPKDITASVREPWMKFYGVGPGTGIALHTGPYKGRLVIPTYSTNHPTNLGTNQSSRVIYSDDHGDTWQSGEAVNDDRLLEDGTRIHSSTIDNREAQNTEATVIQLNNGQVKLFMRNLTGHVQMATSYDGGQTWDESVEDFPTETDVYCQMSAIQTVQAGQEYVLLTNADGPERFNGVVRLAKVEENGKLTWLNKQAIQSGKYAYNALQQIDTDEFAVLYEHAEGEQNEYQIVFKSFNWAYAFDK